MAIYLKDALDLRLNKTPFYLPLNMKNKRKNSAIFLLSPDIKSSIKLMDHPLTISKGLFESYYIEKDINFIINESNHIEEDTSSAILETYLMEMTKKERDSIPDSQFGLEEERKYPLNSAEHVRSAIKLFGHCPENRKKHLAKRIMAAAKKHGVEVKENTEVYKYANNKAMNEGINESLTEEPPLFNPSIARHSEDIITESGFDFQNETKTYRTIFGDTANEMILNEGYSQQLRKMLYNERIKNQKEAILVYDKVKKDCPFIKYTYLNYRLYKERNLFIDWAYYTENFFKHLKWENRSEEHTF